MKAIFASYNQAYNDEIILLLESLGQKGFTSWEEISGRGSESGEPHLGSHAWPVMNNALLTIVDDSLTDSVMRALKAKNEEAPELGLRAFVWNIENCI